jgi:hypothetical protein
MSFLPDLTPLIQQIQEFNQNQLVTNQLLTQILQELRSKNDNEIKALNSQIEDQLKSQK